MTEHFHADVIEDGRTTSRTECFVSPEALVQARLWLLKEIEADKNEFSSYMRKQMLETVIAFDGTTEVVEVTSGYMSYRIMSIDGGCEYTI